MSQTINIDATSIFSDVQKLRQQSPLVHNITNFVAMNSSANILLALGASPVMAHAPDEIEEIENIANSLVINIGTLDIHWIEPMKMAQQYALQQQKPIILDPVGVGASTLRTETAQKLMSAGIDIVRGNGSEIMALANYTTTTKGVDSLVGSEAAIAAAKQLAEQYQCVVVVSGADDFIVTQTTTLKLSNGTPLFTKVTAMGCGATATIGAFAAINDDYTLAAAHAMTVYTIAGEYAAKNAMGPGSFYTQFLDKLYTIESVDLKIANIMTQ